MASGEGSRGGLREGWKEEEIGTQVRISVSVVAEEYPVKTV
jgi:hypothetical protein